MFTKPLAEAGSKNVIHKQKAPVNYVDRGFLFI
jgi:hypothetical protein